MGEFGGLLPNHQVFYHKIAKPLMSIYHNEAIHKSYTNADTKVFSK